ncbi:MAG: HAD hydrolase-like protein [Bacteroidales bacterium]|nr:HAD hydrolase-like protein [Bacteroidales bacterium]
MNQKSIIWDWNGTLLADVEYCIKIMNVLLSERTLPLLNADRYREVFDFPVKKYYQDIGIDFTKDPFSDIGLRFMDMYLQNVDSLELVDNAHEVLSIFKQQNYSQFILSAMEQQALYDAVHQRKIGSYFSRIDGIDNHYGGGKAELAKTLISTHHLDKKNTWLIGDTLHDAEVAGIIGCNCLLVSYGHQSKSRLKSSGLPVFDNLSDVKQFLSQ